MSRFPGSYAGLTIAQASLLSFLRERQAAGLTPTFEEMRQQLSLASKSSVDRLLAGLEERGYISRRPGHHRAIVCLSEAELSLLTISTAKLVEMLEGRGFRFYGKSAELA